MSPKLPSNGHDIQPKHVGVVYNKYKNTVHLVGGEVCAYWEDVQHQPKCWELFVLFWSLFLKASLIIIDILLLQLWLENFKLVRGMSTILEHDCAEK
jgi:hypothetical protein